MHVASSIMRLKNNADKITEVQGKLFAVSGPSADAVNFMEFIEKNIRLSTLRNGVPLSTKAAANFTRNELAHALRNGPYQCDMLIAGCDTDGPALYFMDYLAACEKVNKAAHGYGAYFALSVMDRYYKPNMDVEEAKDVIRKCIAEMSHRFVLHMEKFKCKVVRPGGLVEEIDL